MSYSDWLVSSRQWTTQTPTIDGSPEDVTAPKGFLYLIHPDPLRDMLERVRLAMVAAGVPDAAAFVTEDRHVRLESSAVFTVVWGAATLLQDLLGFDADLAGADGYTAEARSDLLWSPGKIFTPELAPLNAHGQPVADVSMTIGPRGVGAAREEGEPSVIQRFTARHIPIGRYMSSAPDLIAGEYTSFWRTELVLLKHWIVLREVQGGVSPTAPAGYAGALALGPYILDLTDRSQRRRAFTRAQGFALVECYYTVTIAAIQTPEYT